MKAHSNLLQGLCNLWVITFHELGLWKAIEEKLILKLLGNPTNQKACDIACGIGRLSVKIAKSGGEVFGMDRNRNERLIRIGKASSGDASVSFLVGDAEHLPYRSNVFDKAICACSPLAFFNDEVALREINRKLRRGSTLVLTVDSFSYPGLSRKLIETHMKENSAVNYYTEETLADKLQKAGFDVELLQYYVRSPLSVAIFKLNFRLRHLPFIQLLFFLFYPLCQLSDARMPNRSGYFLAAIAHKASEP